MGGGANRESNISAVDDGCDGFGLSWSKRSFGHVWFLPYTHCNLREKAGRNSGGSTNGTDHFNNIGQDVQFTGTSKYDVTWGETDVTRYNGYFMTNGLIHWSLLDKPKIDGRPDKMDIKVTRAKADAYLP